jgi:hypothetical protein
MFRKILIFTTFFFLTQALLTAQNTEAVSLKSGDSSITKAIVSTLSKNLPINDSKKNVTAKSIDSLITKTQAPVDTNALEVKQMDSIWLKSGKILIGTILLNKDKNVFLFSKDTIQNSEIKADDITRLTIFPKKETDERADIFVIFNEFYFLESNPHVPIRVFAHKTFKAILDDGPKHYISQTKYCLFKNDVPYFINSGKTKETLLFLMNDCKAVIDGFKSGQYNKNNFIEAVTHYNRCN